MFDFIPEGIDREAWEGYVEMRKKIKAPLTDRAKTLTFRELEKLKRQGNDPNDVLDQSTQLSWRGVWPLREPQKKPIETSGAWQTLRDSIRSQKAPADPAVAKIIGKLGGLYRLGEMTSFDIENKLRKQFDEMYKTVVIGE